MIGYWPRRWRTTATVRSIATDLAVVVAWVVLVTMAFRLAGGPAPLYYVVVFGGILAYSLAPAAWCSVRS